MASTALRLSALNPHWASTDLQARERHADERDVAAGGNLALELPVGLRTLREARANGHVAAAVGDHRDELGEVVDIGAQVHIHVADYVGIAGQPGFAECEATAFHFEDERLHAFEAGVEVAGELGGAIVRAVIGNHKSPVVLGLLIEERERCEDALFEDSDFVVTGDDDINAGRHAPIVGVGR